MLLEVGFHVAVTRARLKGQDVDVHVKAKVGGAGQEVAALDVGHVLVVDPLKIVGVADYGVGLVALDAVVETLVHKAVSVTFALVLKEDLLALGDEDVAAVGHGLGGLAIGNLDGAVKEVDEELLARLAPALSVLAALMHGQQVIDEGAAELGRTQDGDVAVLEAGDDVLDAAVGLDDGPVALDDGAVLQNVVAIASVVVAVAHDCFLSFGR